MEQAIIINNGLKIDMLNGTIGSSTGGVKIRIGASVYTVPNFGNIPATYGFSSVIFYNIVTNSIVVSTSVEPPKTHFYELCRWVNEAKKWIGNEGNIQITLSDANVNWNLEKFLFIGSLNNSKKIVIDLNNQTIEIPSFLHWIYSDSLNNQSLTTPQTIDFSAIPNSRTVYVYFDKTENIFIASPDTVKPTNGNRELYFVTSFRKEATKEANVTFNQGAILMVTANDSEIIKWTALGDSLTFGGGWQPKAIELLGQKIELVNMGVNGSTMTGNSNNSMVMRSVNIPSDTKLLTIFGGTNDTNQTIGTIGNYDTTTFIGAYQTTIENAYTINPSMRIILVIPSKSWDSNLVEVDRLAIRNAIYEVAKRYGLPTVNLYDEMGMNEFNQQIYLSDRLHYNDNGKLTVGRIFAEKIKQYF